MNVKINKYNNEIKLGEELIYTLPDDLSSLQTAIKQSEYILGLAENWDDEGAEAYTKKTWIKAISFLCDFSINTFKIFGKIPVIPKIYHGLEGSIDILWKTKDINLLLNIPKDDEPATFSGENSLGQEYEGSLNIENYSLSFLPHPF